MKIQVFTIVLLIVLIFTIGLYADSTDNSSNWKAAKGEISWPCTAKCAGWWKCRIYGFFLRKCDKPAGCECSHFAWER